MKKYLLLYKGPATQPGASHAGWPEWFQGIGEALVDKGSPMVHGRVVSEGDAQMTALTSLNGYSIVQAEDDEAVAGLVRSHPFVLLGPQFAIEIFELPAK